MKAADIYEERFATHSEFQPNQISGFKDMTAIFNLVFGNSEKEPVNNDRSSLWNHWSDWVEIWNWLLFLDFMASRLE